MSAEHFLSRNPHFCRSALARFSSCDFLALVDLHGVAWHERDHGQLFCDRSSQEIIDLLRDECTEGGVQWAHPCAVERVERAAGAGAAERGTAHARFAVSTDRGAFHCTSLVVATGGLAIPLLGATPFGYTIAEQFGLRIVPPKPALVPLALAPDSLAALAPLAGVAFAAETRCATPDAPRFRENVLITHRGMSGPAVLQVSSYWQAQEYAGGSRRPVVIDLLPGIDAREWLEQRRDSRALLANLLSESLPRRFAREWCALHDWNTPLNQWPATERHAVARALNAWTLMPSGTLGFAKAEVTLGGVDTRGLSSQTMEATTVPGLFFIGEVVDVTGWLGGYNFQWAWSSGWVAGQFV